MGSAQTDTNDINNIHEQLLLQQLPETLQHYCQAGQSVAQMAHLAKNIIQMVSGSVEIMELGLERKQYDRVLRSWNIFEPNFIRLKKFVLDLIKYTKHTPLQKTDCDFNQAVQKGIGSCEKLLKHKHVKIRLHQDQTIPAAQLDSERLEETVMNLIIHAFDNLSDQMGEVTIRTQWLADQQQIQLVVSDDGPALSETVQQQLAEPFERTRNMYGTGFDLPLAKLVVEQHNGYLEISSGETAGNTVSVYLPVA